MRATPEAPRPSSSNACFRGGGVLAHRDQHPEPLRWLGVRGSRWILAAADAYEYRTNRQAKTAAALASKLRND